MNNSPFRKISQDIEQDLRRLKSSIGKTPWFNFLQLNLQQRQLDKIKSKVLGTLDVLSHQEHQSDYNQLFYWYLAEIRTLSQAIDEKNELVNAFRKGSFWSKLWKDSFWSKLNR
ncbi:MAG: hypothetical protein F6K30_00740 [Cyanothece sp. SIO2G6]|nr:hypothetical protein [Cyanothece sp. SIO2G6]